MQSKTAPTKAFGLMPLRILMLTVMTLTLPATARAEATETAETAAGTTGTAAGAPAAPPASLEAPVALRSASPSAAEGAALELANRIVDNFRRNILLHEAQPGKTALAQTGGGRYLFYQNRLLSMQLMDALAANVDVCLAVLSHIVQAGDWRDADRLALGGVAVELALRLPPDAACAPASWHARSVLAAIRARYNREFTAALGGQVSGRSNTEAGGTESERERERANTRSAWQSYVSFLRTRFAGQPLIPEPGISAAPRAGTATPLARRGERDEWTDGGLPPRTVLLTFDDGPHPLHTPRVLDILARYGIKAIFFQVGQNIGTLNAAPASALANTGTATGAAASVRAAPVGATAQPGAPAATIREPRLIERILAEGHAVANHTHTHPLLPTLDEIKLTAEIDQTEALLNAAARGHAGHAALFRPPYGARNDLVLAEVTARGLRSVLWNIDSRDWADPVAQSVARRVIDEAVREGSGIVLFHDIHARAPDALPTVIEELQKRGFRFARYAAGQLVVDP